MTKAGMDYRELQLKIEEYSDMLFKLSYIRLQNVQDAEDVVQETFYQYFKNTKPFESPEHEKAWLLKVTMNSCRKIWRSAWRRHQNDRRQDSDSRDDSPFCSEKAVAEDADSLFAGPEETVVRQEERRYLLEAVWKLPEKYRDVIHLFYYEELSVKEIAQVTGRGVSTVTSQLTRGRELLKKSLKEEYDFE